MVWPAEMQAGVSPHSSGSPATSVSLLTEGRVTSG